MDGHYLARTARFSLLFAAIANANAAVAQTVPGFLNSNPTESSLPAPNLPVDAYKPSTPDVQVASDPVTADALMSDTLIFVRGVQVEGGSVYQLEQLSQIYQPFVDREVTLGELIEVTRELTRRYHNDGYMLSYAYLPEQNFSQGIVRVGLVEGYVSQYQISGEVGSVAAYIEKLLQPILAERPLTQKTFDRYTTLLSSIPGVSFAAQVPPPSTTDGATTLLAEVSRKSFTTQMNLVEAKNQSAQAMLSATSNSHTRWGEQLSVAALYPPGRDDERYYRVDYQQYLGGEGTKLNLSASHYRSYPHLDRTFSVTQGWSGTTINGVYVETQEKLRQDYASQENNRVSFGVSHPWVAMPTRWLNTSVSLYAVQDKDNAKYIFRQSLYVPVSDELVSVDAPLDVNSKSDIRVLSAELDWRYSSDNELGYLGVGIYQGLNNLGASTGSDQINIDFSRVRLSVMHSLGFAQNWQAVGAAVGYWSDDILPESEQVAFGGQNFGRGYPSDQASGDKGWGASLELNYLYAREMTPWLRMLQPYVVLDGARSSYNGAIQYSNKLSSAAFGLRFGDSRYYNISLEIAKPMSDVAIDSRDRSYRYTIGFSYQL